MTSDEPFIETGVCVRVCVYMCVGGAFFMKQTNTPEGIGYYTLTQCKYLVCSLDLFNAKL